MKIKDLEKLDELSDSLESIGEFIADEWTKIYNGGYGHFDHFEMKGNAITFHVEDILPRGGGVDRYDFALSFEDVINWKEWARREAEKKKKADHIKNIQKKEAEQKQEKALFEKLKQKYQ